MNVIEKTIRELGITRRYKGYTQLIYLLEYALTDVSEEKSAHDLYFETASHFGCRWTAVESNMRTLAARAWKINSKRISEMADCSLSKAPTSTQLIRILSTHIRKDLR